MKFYLSKILMLLTRRPTKIYPTLRAHFLFYWVHWLSRFIYGAHSGVILGENTRIQTLTGLFAERPDSQITIGEQSVIYENAVVEAYAHGRIEIGAASVLGDIRIVSRKSIKIGARFLSSWNVFIQDFDPHPVSPDLRAIQVHNICANFRPRFNSQMQSKELDWTFPTAEVEIGDDVWVGANVTILKGARIGSGCIVASNAVVTSGIYPARSILAGNPAKVVKEV